MLVMYSCKGVMYSLENFSDIVVSEFIGTKFVDMLCSVSVVRGSLVVSVLDCQSRGPGFKSRPGLKFGLRFRFHLHPWPTQL